ncbi:MAG: hypothetical protein ACT4N8_01225 [Sphingosinicella sp.]|uniref:hypothetical protein n=1 Tax=Sphingosinicella sp. TaxID=1917971 RepID=UPI00403821FF
MSARNPWLVVGGCLSLAAAVLHLACVVGGPGWYRFFGAGEEMARAAERGSWTPPLLTLGIAAILALWAAYAFAGAGLFRRLPLMRTALVAISAIYLLRGLFVFSPALFNRPDLSSAFMFWSSLIVLAYGIAYAVGTWRAWPQLSQGKVAHALGSSSEGRPRRQGAARR